MKNPITNKHQVLTGISALSFLNIINFDSEMTYVAMIRGNKSNLENKIKVFTQRDVKVLKYEAEEKNGVTIYSPERLFVELGTFNLEFGLKSMAEENLKKICNPYKVSKIYNFLSTNVKKRKLDNKTIKDFLSKSVMQVEEAFKSEKYKNNDVLREYVLGVWSKFEVPVLVKGGTAVELYIDKKRATQDVDAHIGNTNLVKILAPLLNEENIIYFEFQLMTSPHKKHKNKDAKYSELITNIESLQRAINNSEKLINTFKIKPKTHKTKLKSYLAKTELKVTLNLSINQKEINEYINDFKLIKKPLRIINNKSCLLFSKEMIVAEKIFAILKNPEATTRTKDLLDIYLLFDDDLNFKNVYKWFINKNNSSKNKETNLFDFIVKQKNKELTLIKNNWIDASKNYFNEVIAPFDEALKIYLKIIAELENKLYYLQK